VLSDKATISSYAISRTSCKRKKTGRRRARVFFRSGGSSTRRYAPMHRVVSLLKRWLLGIYQGAVRSEQHHY